MSSDIIVAFITGVMGPVTLLYVKNLLDKKKKKPDRLLSFIMVVIFILRANLWPNSV
jgi:capsular polysaccharide biosynthesis protein